MVNYMEIICLCLNTNGTNETNIVADGLSYLT